MSRPRCSHFDAFVFNTMSCFIGVNTVLYKTKCSELNTILLNFLNKVVYIFKRFKTYFYYLKGGETEVIGNLPSASHSSNFCSSQGWARLKPGAQNSCLLQLYLNSHPPSWCPGAGSRHCDVRGGPK